MTFSYFKDEAMVTSTCRAGIKTPHLSAGVAAPCCVVTISLVLFGGCSAVLYEALDDSPDDMYLDWFQGQLCPSDGPGLVGPVCIIDLHILPPNSHGLRPNLCHLSFSLWSLASIFLSVSLLNLSDFQLQGCCFAKLQNSRV